MVSDSVLHSKNISRLFTHLFSKNRRRSRRARYWLPPLLALAMTNPTIAASLQGTVVNNSGEPLSKVPVCLRTAGEDRRCSKMQSTDRDGRYRFNGLKDGDSFHIAVFQDDSAAGRKFERYRTYVWSPLEQTALAAAGKSSASLQPFVGEFNFSNYQRGLQLTGANFPELRSLDLVGDYVMLKVFLAPTAPELPPETIFLGRVMNADTLSVAASVPLSTTSINYQIYSASLSIDGSISLNGSR